MDTRLFVLHTSSYLYLVLSYMAAQGAFSWLASVVFGERTALNLLFMIFASSGMMAFGFFHRYFETRGRLLTLLLMNGAARAAMELLTGQTATFAAILFLVTCGWMLAMVLHRTARLVPYEYLGRFVGGSMALATGLMFLLSMARGFAPLTPLGSAAAFGATAWLLWTDRPLSATVRYASPRLHTTRNLSLLVAVAMLLSLAYGINDSTSYLRFEEFRDVFGLSRLALGLGLFLAGHLADRRRAYLPLAAVLGGAATMIFHAMTLEGGPPAALFYANEFFWSFSLLFILIVFMEASLRTKRPELWAGMGRLIEMPAEGLGAASGMAMMAAFPPSAVLTAYTLVLAVASGLLYHELLSHAESTFTPLPPQQLCPAIEVVAATEVRAEADNDTATDAPTSEALLTSWQERYTLTNREAEILRASLSDDTAANIGKSLFITTSTVRFHLTHLLKKTGFSTRKELSEAFFAELDGNHKNNEK